MFPSLLEDEYGRSYKACCTYKIFLLSDRMTQYLKVENGDKTDFFLLR